jgi:hypothetical protein
MTQTIEAPSPRSLEFQDDTEMTSSFLKMMKSQKLTNNNILSLKV